MFFACIFIFSLLKISKISFFFLNYKFKSVSKWTFMIFGVLVFAPIFSFWSYWETPKNSLFIYFFFKKVINSRWCQNEYLWFFIFRFLCFPPIFSYSAHWETPKNRSFFLKKEKRSKKFKIVKLNNYPIFLCE